MSERKTVFHCKGCNTSWDDCDVLDDGQCASCWREEAMRLRAERDTAQRVFRALRAAWFAAHLRSNAHEREWEDEEHEKRRHERNSDLLAWYASQTEGILNGEDWPVFPTCDADMDTTNARAAGGTT